jgi:hypothetical protein
MHKHSKYKELSTTSHPAFGSDIRPFYLLVRTLFGHLASTLRIRFEELQVNMDLVRHGSDGMRPHHIFQGAVGNYFNV